MELIPVLLQYSPTAGGKQVAIAYDRLAPELSTSLLIESITRWLEQSQPEAPRAIALRSSLLVSSLLDALHSHRQLWNLLRSHHACPLFVIKGNEPTLQADLN